jgi:hypothetical protein
MRVTISLLRLRRIAEKDEKHLYRIGASILAGITIVSTLSSSGAVPIKTKGRAVKRGLSPYFKPDFPSGGPKEIP